MVVVLKIMLENVTQGESPLMQEFDFIRSP